jgi:uncharacterized protein (DUF2236 family)
VNRFLTTGFLPPPFREQMQLSWTGRDQELFDFLIQLAAAANRLLPPRSRGSRSTPGCTNCDCR